MPPSRRAPRLCGGEQNPRGDAGSRTRSGGRGWRLVKWSQFWTFPPLALLYSSVSPQSTGGFGCHEGQSSRGQLSTDNPALHLRLWGCPDAVLLFLHGHMQTIAFAQDGLAESTCMQICAGKSMKKERGFILIPLIYSHQMSVQCHIKIFNDFKTNGP